ncbi:Xylose isomerase-like TIM barrel [compost metagenome]
MMLKTLKLIYMINYTAFYVSARSTLQSKENTMKISVFYNHILTASEQTKLTVEQVLNRVHEFGIDAVELDLDEVKPGKEEMREQFLNAGISVASMYAFFDFGNAPDAEPGFRFIDTAEYLGASKVLVIPGFIEESEGPAERENALNRMVGVLREMCNYAEGRI